MGFLGFGNYDKPGKGVSKNEPEKKGFFLFWEIVIQKLAKIFSLNALYTLTSVIWLALLAVFCIPMLLSITPETAAEALREMGQEADLDAASGALRLIYTNGAFLIFNFLGSGPATAAYAYIVKCYSQRQPVWILSDGWDKFKENFKQASVVLLVNAAVLFFGGTALKFYYTMASGGQLIYSFLLYIMIVLLIVFAWMQFYIYQIMVSAQCTIKQLYKNALIFAIAKLPINLFLTLLAGAVSLLPYIFTSSMVTVIIFSGIIGMFFTRFAIEFSAARTVNKLLIKNKNRVSVTYDDEEKTVFDDNLAEKIKREEK